MAIKINISGVDVKGSSKILNNMKVGNGNVDISVRDTSIGDRTEVLNDMGVGSGNVDVRIKNSEIADRARVLSNPNIKDGNLRVNLENTVLKGDRILNTEQDSHNSESKRGRDQTMPETAIVEVTRKKSLLQKIIEFFKGSKRDISQVQYVPTETEFVKDAHKKFEDQLSMNGQLKNITMTLERKEREDKQQSREENER